jgi:hypothetical protein
VVGALLLRGMVAGAVAGLLCFGFLRLVGEPPIERAIAFEEQREAAEAARPHPHTHGGGTAEAPKPPEPELVSREVQAGIGLFTGVVVYSIAFGGLYALAFALAYGRISAFGPRGAAATLAVLGFVAVSLVPMLKYPASPPAVGDPATLGRRTALYFGFVALSLAAMIVAGMLRRRVEHHSDAWTATVTAGAFYVAVMVVVSLALPAVNEVPEGFPATVLWQFRVAALGAQAILWTTLGLLFGPMVERTGAVRGRARVGAG